MSVTQKKERGKKRIKNIVISSCTMDVVVEWEWQDNIELTSKSPIVKRVAANESCGGISGLKFWYWILILSVREVFLKFNLI